MSKDYQTLNRRALDIENQEPTDEDIDEIPLSLFIERHNTMESCWEWMLNEIKTCPKLMLYESGTPRWWIYAISSFGWFYLGAWDEATDSTFGVGGPFYFYWTDSQLVFASGRFPEIVRIQTTFANQAAIDAYLAVYLPQFYSVEQRNANLCSLIFNTQVLYTTREFFEKYQGRIFHAYNFVADKRKGKNIITFNAQEMLDQLQEEVNTWAYLPGFRTDYIDNLGIFVPTGWEVNDVRTQELRGQFGETATRYVVVHKLLGTEADIGMEIGSSIPIVGMPFRWAKQSIRRQEFLMPIVMAFGRQMWKVPSESQFIYEAQNMGYGRMDTMAAPLRVPNFGHATFPLDQWRRMRSMLRSQVVIPDSLWSD